MSKPRSVILLFVDGVGVGPRNPATNPFARLAETRLGRFHDEFPDTPVERDRPDPDSRPPLPAGPVTGPGPGWDRSPLPLSEGGFWTPLDASLGVPGLPQSATGQATILTGVNAPRRVGRHVSAIPDRKVRELLEEDNLFRILRRAGRRATFANAYTPAYFARKRPHVSATTRSLLAAEVPLRRLEDLRAGRALFHDYTNEALRMREPAERTELSPPSLPSPLSPPSPLFPPSPTSPPSPPSRPSSPSPPSAARASENDALVPARSAEDAATILFELAREHDFTLHEHFLTDLAGHRGTDEERLLAARRIEALVEHLARGAMRQETLVLVVSDHGNLEDLTQRTHTLNPVPFLAWGPGAREAVGMCSDLTHVAPAILSSLGLPSP